jgi:hypothetical protein
MNATSEAREPSAASDELIAALEHVLSKSPQNRRTIARLERQPSSYQSSSPLEELTLVFDDGQQLDLIFKNVSPAAFFPHARRAKPDFLDDPQREIEVYRTILAHASLGTPHFFGSVVDTENDRFWLFLERVAGRELYQVGDAGVWQDAARWLAHFHHQFSSSEALPPHTVRRLVRLDEPYYRQWFERAAEFAGSEKGIRNESVCRLAAHAPALVEQLLELPVGLIHGEFYASQIATCAFVRSTGSGRPSGPGSSIWPPWLPDVGPKMPDIKWPLPTRPSSFGSPALPCQWINSCDT